MMGYVEPCAVNAFNAIVDRQAGTQVSPDPVYAREFARFGEWLND